MCDYRLLLKSLTLSWQMSFSLCFRSMIHIIIYGWLQFVDSECWLDNLSLCSPLIFSLLLSSSSVLQFPTLISSSHFIFFFHNDFVPYYLLPYFVFTLTTFPMFSFLHSSSFFSSWFYSFLPFFLFVPYLLAILFSSSCVSFFLLAVFFFSCFLGFHSLFTLSPLFSSLTFPSYFLLSSPFCFLPISPSFTSFFLYETWNLEIIST